MRVLFRVHIRVSHIKLESFWKLISHKLNYAICRQLTLNKKVILQVFHTAIEMFSRSVMMIFVPPQNCPIGHNTAAIFCPRTKISSIFCPSLQYFVVGQIMFHRYYFVLGQNTSVLFCPIGPAKPRN